MPADMTWTLDGESLVPMLERQGKMERDSALGWVTGHLASQQITGLPVSNCDNGTCADGQTRYDHVRSSDLAWTRPGVCSLALPMPEPWLPVDHVQQIWLTTFAALRLLSL